MQRLLVLYPKMSNRRKDSSGLIRNDKKVITDPVTAWLANHSTEVSKFAGLCIGIDKNYYKIVTSGTTSTQVIRAAQKIDPKMEIILYKVLLNGLSI